MACVHLLDLPGGDWRLWRSVCVRGAGFPLRLLLGLASDATARAADALIDAEQEAHMSALQAATLLASTSAPGDALRPLLKAKRELHKGRVPEGSFDGGGPADLAIGAVRAAQARVKEARHAFDAAFAAASKQASDALRGRAGDPRFREALAWQNLRAVSTALDPLRRGDASPPWRHRQHEQLVLSYLQRYCAKNDTIGFFGPWGWGSFDPQGATVQLRHGAEFLASRSVHFEQWAVDAIAAAIARADERVLSWVAPRRSGFVRLEGDVATHPVSGRVELSRAEAVTLRACDGTRDARALCKALVAEQGELFELESDVEDTLRSLVEKDLVAWRLEVPFTWDPDRALRAILERVDDSEVRDRALGSLDRIEARRQALASAAGDPDAVAGALRALDASFTELTGQAASRLAGETYAGRAIVFEDAVRGTEVTFGPAVLDALGPPLGLVLTSARWLTWETARRYREAFAKLHAELAPDGGAVSFVDLWTRAQRLLYGSKERPVDQVLEQLGERWASVLGVDRSMRRLDFRTEDLRAKVMEAFSAPGPGWASARYHSPDVLLAAEGPDALARGDFFAVLGEVHASLNTIDQATIVNHHPDPDAVRAWVAEDVPERRFMVVLSKDWRQSTVRLLPTIAAEKDLWLESTVDPAPAQRSHVILAADLDVVPDPRGPRARSADGRVDVDLIELLAQPLRETVAQSFFILPPVSDHWPRVTVDRLVLQRETWVVAPSSLPFADEQDAAARFLGARKWARSVGLPRFVFVRSAVEVKPVYLDLESPVFVTMLSRIARGAREHVAGETPLVLSEMLPSPTQAWLTDAQGELYTSELRIVAVDRKAPASTG
jgi:hypothetical protein